jgi:hypothetical protein
VTRRDRIARDVAAWNERHPVGTLVRYWTWTRTGDGKVARTRHAAVVMGDHGSVWIEGVVGCVAVSHVEPVSVPDAEPHKVE